MSYETSHKKLEHTRMFWNNNPCDGQETAEGRRSFRYRKEPWLPALLEQIGNYSDVLEIGCGQGTDALYCCSGMRVESSYTGIDLSNASIEKAGTSAGELSDSLKVYPRFVVGNAEQLVFHDNTFDCVTSFGVLHHTPDIVKALSEIDRVLIPGGIVFITLYRSASPKILTARAMRLISWVVDKLTLNDRLLYKLIKRGMGVDGPFGTMFHEALGVPILNSYTKGQIMRLFPNYDIEKLIPIGMGFPFFGINHIIDKARNPIGAQWLIIARKPPPS